MTENVSDVIKNNWEMWTMMAILKYSVQVKTIKKMFLKYTHTGAIKGLIFQLSSPKKVLQSQPYLFIPI